MVFISRFLLCSALPLYAASFAFGAEDDDARPPVIEKAETARWMAHNLDWGVLATTSERLGSTSSGEFAPFANPYSFADGTVDASTGNLYFYTSEMDQSMVDVFDTDKGGHVTASFALSEAMANGGAGTSCQIGAEGDPENPTCGRCVFTGNYLNISGTEEESVAEKALMSRHPMMADWPSDHSWFYAKLDIEDIWLIDIYGGASNVDVSDYFAVTL